MRFSFPFAFVMAAVPLFFNAPTTRAADEAFVVKPYLQIGQNPGLGHLHVLWHAADDDASWSVELRVGANGDWKKVADVGSLKVAAEGIALHRVYNATLTGLEPGVTFHYRVSKGKTVVFAAEGSGPKRADQPFRYVIMGDCGAGTDEQLPLASRAFKAKPDLVVIPGDIVYENGLISEYHKFFWPVYNADEVSLKGAPLMRSIPFVAAPGNHDTETRDLDKNPDALAYYLYWNQPLNGPECKEGGAFLPELKGADAKKTAFLTAANANYPRMTNFSFNVGNAHWTVVDSNPYVDWTDKQLPDWVAADLASPAAKAATWRFVAFHHPGFNSALEHIEQEHMRLLSPIFEAGKVDIVFNGHVHNYQRSYPLTFAPFKKSTLLVGGRDSKTVRGRVVPGHWTLDKTFDGKENTSPKGVIYIVTGAGGQHLYNPEQTGDPDSWQKFTAKFFATVHSLTIADIDGKTLTVSQVTADGTELDRFVIKK